MSAPTVTNKEWEEHAAGVMQTNQALLRRVEILADTLGDTLRMLEAVRFTSGLGKKQLERVAKAKAVLAASRSIGGAWARRRWSEP